ncbi:MAG TPA: DUF1697 domain-containing protein [Candidatus Dormibacteraeota bacterium]|nr:DUF1697 domain-containing protein [Candidatus Dormibacteraeota bacterium]
MPSYVALLRGINVGSHNRISMPDLRELVTATGAEDVRTYVQSGNVVFQSADKAAAVEQAIEKAIKTELGLDVAVMVRTDKQLAKVIKANPFPKQPDHKRLLVMFLGEKPKAANVKRLAEAATGPEEFEVLGNEAYMHYPEGYGRSKFGGMWVEKQLAVPGTARNWRSVMTLAEMASE